MAPACPEALETPVVLPEVEEVRVAAYELAGLVVAAARAAAPAPAPGGVEEEQVAGAADDRWVLRAVEAAASWHGPDGPADELVVAAWPEALGLQALQGLQLQQQRRPRAGRATPARAEAFAYGHRGVRATPAWPEAWS
eukprot:10385358-Alexandrium_andersonii.AAC.1